MTSTFCMTGLPDATLEVVSDLPLSLIGGTRVGPYSSARPGMLLRVVPRIGRFLVLDGTRVEVCMETGADASAVEAVVEGAVAGALMHQRGELPLHATTLVGRDGQAIALAGDSGAGKSTAAFELIQRGWRLLSDDLTRVTLSDGGPIAWPGRATLRLRRDACDSFGLDPVTLQPAPGWRDKFVVPVIRWNEPAAL